MQLMVNIDVPDLPRAEAFYCAAFGLTAGRRFDGALELLGTDARIYLLAKAAGSEGVAGSPRTYARHWTPLHCDWVVDDLELAATRAAEAGAVMEGPIREAKWGRFVQLADPFGHGWCLLQFRGRGYDEIAQ